MNLTQGVYSLDGQADTASLTNPRVTGVAGRWSWAVLEPTPGQYDLSSITAAFAAAQRHGKKLSLSVACGAQCPDWLYDDPSVAAQPFSFVSIHPSSAGQTLRCPVPWDPAYLNRLGLLALVLGQAFSDALELTNVKLTGVNDATQELQLPHAAGQTVTVAGKTFATLDDVANWQAAGYTRPRVVAAWSQAVGLWNTAFPVTQLAAMVLSAGFPPLDDAGVFIPGTNHDPVIVGELLDAAVGILGDRWVCQNNGLVAGRPLDPVTADQARLGRYTTYQMGGRAGSPTNLRTALSQAVSGGAHAVEVYHPDCNAPGMQGALAWGNTNLV
jgi:hypothetical protein